MSEKIDEQELYGCAIAAYAQSAHESITFELGGAGLVLGTVLSEAHELIDVNPRAAGQILNRAKYLINYFGLINKTAPSQ